MPNYSDCTIPSQIEIESITHQPVRHDNIGDMNETTDIPSNILEQEGNFFFKLLLAIALIKMIISQG